LIFAFFLLLGSLNLIYGQNDFFSLVTDIIPQMLLIELH